MLVGLARLLLRFFRAMWWAAFLLIALWLFPAVFDPPGAWAKLQNSVDTFFFAWMFFAAIFFVLFEVGRLMKTDHLRPPPQ